MTWVDIPIGRPVLTNVDETALDRDNAALENAYVNDKGGHTRFPGQIDFVPVSPGRVYLDSFRDDLLATTSLGQVWRIDRNGNAENVTGVPVTGGRRTIFDETDDSKVMAAGGSIVKFAGGKTELLSPDAPNSTHVGYLAGRLIAPEPDSHRLGYCEAGLFDQWPGLNFFSAEAKHDNVTALLVSQYGELFAAGPKSVEQFEPSTSGDRPFFPRGAAGEGLKAPYTLVDTKFGLYGVSEQSEFVQYINRSANPQSEPIQADLDGIDSWRDAWATELIAFGQRFILLQMPEATNVYGTKGVTLLFDQKNRYWTSLYGWDDELELPARWPGWSYTKIWNRHFVGGEGKIYELTPEAFDNSGSMMRYLGRTGHYEQAGHELRIDNFKMRFKRGTTDPNIGRSAILAIRMNMDNMGWTDWIHQDLGFYGQTNLVVELGSLGSAHTWQWEWRVTDLAPVELVRVQADITRV